MHVMLRPLQEELRARGQAVERPPAIVKFREPGSKEWHHPCVLLPGRHPTSSEACVDISRICATTHIVVRPAGGGGAGGAAGGDAATLIGEAGALALAGQVSEVDLLASQGPAELPETEGTEAGAEGTQPPQLQPQAPVLQPLRLGVRVRQLQLCLWDDDRRRLLPAAGAPAPLAAAAPPLGSPRHPIHPHPVPGHAVLHYAPPAKELFCITVDGLTFGLSKCPREQPAAGAAAAQTAAPPGAGRSSGGQPVAAQHAQPHAQHTQHAQQQQEQLIEYCCQLLAEGLHCDSFLPGSEYPVVLTTVAEEEGGGGSAAGSAGAQGPGAPVHLAVTVRLGPGECGSILWDRAAGWHWGFGYYLFPGGWPLWGVEGRG